MEISKIQTPFYIVYEEKIRKNLEIITDLCKRADVKFIMAFKANALWKTFPIIREYVNSSTASSLNEMLLSLEHLGGDVHAYCPVYTDASFPEFLRGCSHITFNSIHQFNRFYPAIKEYEENKGKHVSPGLRVNPRCSIVETDIYNPCLPGTRFGVNSEDLHELPEGIEGLHFHALCESDSHDLGKLLEAFEFQFGHLIDKVKWVNMGGGHLVTRKDYDREFFVELMNDFHRRHPDVKIILEPGSAFTWQTGDLITKVLDIVENDGIKTGIIDASFACHMPDCLEMPYQPQIAEALPIDSEDTVKHGAIPYRLGGNSCLSGDFVGDWYFEQPLNIGDRLTLMDMNHYTTVKTTMFNGISHPSIWLQPINGKPICLREYTYNDYKYRMD
ncbi:MAG: carboxynorspermidine decarboxylase [Muribaculaceae bacterium]|nr:carboxynorspermidine decarboxylase [Muribaculaceae bacterium]